MFFGGGGGGRGGRGGRGGPQRGKDMVHPLKVSLDDLYNGRTVKLALTRKKPCVDCKGRGCKAGAERTCSDCSGRGIKIQLRQVGPGMVQQMQSECSSCRGEGKIIDEKDKCQSCKGAKIYQDRKGLEVLIEKGMKNGSKIKYSGEADELPGTQPGDIVIVVQEKEHDRFKRKGSDLVYSLEITLSEALCGFVKTITHLDNRILKIESAAGQVIKNNSVKRIDSEGMPFQGSPFTKGHLFVHFTVVFPKTLPVSTVAQLNGLLPRPPDVAINGEEEDVAMVESDVNQIGASGEGQGQYDEDDEDMRGGARQVQCGQA